MTPTIDWLKLAAAASGAIALTFYALAGVYLVAWLVRTRNWTEDPPAPAEPVEILRIRLYRSELPAKALREACGCYNARGALGYQAGRLLFTGCEAQRAKDGAWIAVLKFLKYESAEAGPSRLTSPGSPGPYDFQRFLFGSRHVPKRYTCPSTLLKVTA